MIVEYGFVWPYTLVAFVALLVLDTALELARAVRECRQGEGGRAT